MSEQTKETPATIGEALKDHQYTRDDELVAASAEPVKHELHEPEVAEVEKSESSLFGPDSLGGAPMGFVRWGTFSSGHEKKIAEEEADAEGRRDEAARERALAKVPIEHGGAKYYAHEFSDAPEIQKAYVPLTYVTRGGDPIFEGYGDITAVIDPKFEGEMALHIICGRCKERLPQGQCVLTIRQSNKHWELDKRKAGELFVFEGQPMYSAGIIRDSERFTCPRCSWRGRIDNNRVRPD